MKIVTVCAVSALGAMTVTAAQAADPYMSQYSDQTYNASPAFSWAGFYAGGQLGASWSDASLASQSENIPVRQSFTQEFSNDSRGFIGGLYGGYNFVLNNYVVLGAETDWVWGKLDKSRAASINDYDFSAQVKQKWAGATRARLGLAADRWLPYVAAGIAYTKINSSIYTSDSDGLQSNLSSTDSDTLKGWTIGGGVDYAMGDNIVLRAEYRYNDFGDQNFGRENIGYKVDYKTNDVRVGVALKF